MEVDGETDLSLILKKPARWAACALAMWMLSACATTGAAPDPSSPDLRTAIAEIDLDAVRAVGATSRNEAERNLARGVEASWRRRDAEALEAFSQAIGSVQDKDLKATASLMAMAVHMRQGNYAEALNSARQADALSKSVGAEAMQAAGVVGALTNERPTRSVGAAKGAAEVTRDMVKLPRVQLIVNGKPQDTVLDTGAAFSTITQSAAQRLGLRMLEAKVAVGTSVTRALESQMAMADSIVIGGVEFRDVAFIVVPDAALTMLDGRYTIEAILGMPVFLEMRRISILTGEDGKEMFRFGAGEPPLKVEPNLVMAALAPLVEAVVDLEGMAAKIRLLLDSGANATVLNARFGDEYSALLKGVEARASREGGAGGMRDGKRRMLESMPLAIGGGRFTLNDISVSDAGGRERHGILGQDLLMVGFVADFDEMKLWLATE